MLDSGSFMKYLQYERHYSSHTVDSYKNDLEQYAQYLITHLDINNEIEATHHHVRSWIVHLMQQSYSAKSINRKLSAVKSYYKFQKKVGKLKVNPASNISGPKLAKRLPHVVRGSDIALGLDQLEDDASFMAQRDLTLLSILYLTGMRRSELINLKDSDIDHSRHTIKVLGKGNKERLIPISAELSDLILAYIERREETFAESEYLLLTDKGQKMYPKFVYNKVRRWIGSISTVDKKGPHILRHTFATHLADSGAELNAIKELLGHSSLAATEIYMHNSIERLKDVYGKAHPRAKKKR